MDSKTICSFLGLKGKSSIHAAPLHDCYCHYCDASSECANVSAIQSGVDLACYRTEIIQKTKCFFFINKELLSEPRGVKGSVHSISVLG